MIPLDDINITSWLFPLGLSFIPEMFIIGFQEIVPLTAKNIVKNQNED